jgi:hypothetical protein
MKEGILTAPEVPLVNKQKIIDVRGPVLTISVQSRNASLKQSKAREIFVANMNA